MTINPLELSPVQRYLERLHTELLSITDGEVANYIPELTHADPAWLGLALVTVDGHVYQSGDSRQPFTIQSISKAITYGKALEDRGMGMYLDVVLNHVGYESKLFEDKPDWFHRKGTITDWSSREQLETHDVHGLPDLDQSKPEVYDYLLAASSSWLSLPGLTGFRLDAVKHIGAAFWSRYNRDLAKRAGPEFRLLGELYDGNPELLATAMREQGFHELFDFPLHFAMVDVFCKGASPETLAATLSLDRLYPDPSRLITFADNSVLDVDVPRAGGKPQPFKEAFDGLKGRA